MRLAAGHAFPLFSIDFRHLPDINRMHVDAVETNDALFGINNNPYADNIGLAALLGVQLQGIVNLENAIRKAVQPWFLGSNG